MNRQEWLWVDNWGIWLMGEWRFVILLFVILFSLLLYMFEDFNFLKTWCWEGENSFPWQGWSLNRDKNKITVDQKRKENIHFYGFISLLPAHTFDCFISLNILNLLKNRYSVFDNYNKFGVLGSNSALLFL